MNNNIRRIVILPYGDFDKTSVLFVKKMFVQDEKGNWELREFTFDKFHELLKESNLINNSDSYKLRDILDAMNSGKIEVVDASKLDDAIDELASLGCINERDYQIVYNQFKREIDNAKYNDSSDFEILNQNKEVNNKEELIGMPPINARENVSGIRPINNQIFDNRTSFDLDEEDQDQYEFGSHDNIEDENPNERKSSWWKFALGLGVGAAGGLYLSKLLGFKLDSNDPALEQKVDNTTINTSITNAEKQYENLAKKATLSDQELALLKQLEAEIEAYYDAYNFGEFVNLDQLTGVQKEFVEQTMNFIKNFNEKTHKANNFRLKEDNEYYLDINFMEAMAMNLVLNNYTQDEINQIFGDYNLEANTIDALVKSAWAKLSVYYMNAVETSGLSDLINDEDGKRAFEEIESKVLAFNKKPSREAATDIHRAAYYYFLSPGISGDYAQSYSAHNADNAKRMVSFFAVAPLEGFVRMNSATPYQVQEYMITHLNNEDEKRRCNGNDAYLRDGTYFVDLIYHEGVLVVDNEDINPNYNQGRRGYTSIMSQIDAKGLCVILEDRAREISDMIKESSKVYKEYEESKDEKVSDARKFVENALLGDGDYRYDLFNALGNSGERYKDFLLRNFNTEDIREAEDMLYRLINGFDIDDISQIVDFSTGKLNESELNRIRALGEEGRKLASLYENLYKEIMKKQISMGDIVIAAEKELEKLPNYQGHSKDSVSYLVNVRYKKMYEKYMKQGYQGYVGEIPYQEPSVELVNEVTTTETSTRTITQTHVSEGPTREYVTTEVEEVSREDLTPEELAQAEAQEQQYNISNLINNIAANASISLNSFVNSTGLQLSPEIVEYMKKYGIDISKESLINQAILIRAWYDGTISEINPNSPEIQAAKMAAANSFISGLSQSEKDALRKAYGSNWESQVKNEFMSQWQSDLDEVWKEFVEDYVSLGEYQKQYGDLIDGSTETEEEEEFDYTGPGYEVDPDEQELVDYGEDEEPYVPPSEDEEEPIEDEEPVIPPTEDDEEAVEDEEPYVPPTEDDEEAVEDDEFDETGPGYEVDPDEEIVDNGEDEIPYEPEEPGLDEEIIDDNELPPFEQVTPPVEEPVVEAEEITDFTEEEDMLPIVTPEENEEEIEYEEDELEPVEEEEYSRGR